MIDQSPAAATAATVQPPVVALENVSKNFGSTRALSDVTLTVRRGEVVGLVGDNGAGKSTIVKLMTGYFQPSKGHIAFDGRDVRFSSPVEARRLGIEAVFQDLALIDELSLWRNFFLGKELHKPAQWPVGILDKDQMRRICRDRLQKIGLTRYLSVDGPASVLSGGEKQSLSITRAVHFGARLLLLDEPTAALSVRETQAVFRTIESAREQGLGIMYIDHNVAHVHPIADRIVIVEHGRVVATFKRGEVSVADLTELLSKQPTAEIQ